MTSQDFRTLGVTEPLLRGLRLQNFTQPTPIQARAIPLVLEGEDVLGIAQTGTGKTAAFSLPILQQLAGEKAQTRNGRIRALILAPTRELVVQIDQTVRVLSRDLRLFSLPIYGGVGRRPQIDKLRRGVDIVVATPGRFMDLLQEGHIDLNGVRHLVLDEADRLLDMGFIHDIKRIVAQLPKERQSLLFSATMPKTVAHLAADVLNEPKRVEVERQTPTPNAIEQRVIHVAKADKRELLTDLLANKALSRVIVFTRTKHMANRVAEHLEKADLPAEALHGNKSQSARQNALKRFHGGKARVLVATDIAARGIDVPKISHVINFDLPNEPESYVHRIGRTARAGGSGVALSFCDSSELAYLRDIERLLGRSLEAEGEVPSQEEMARAQPAGRNKRPGGARPNSRNGHKNKGRRFGSGDKRPQRSNTRERRSA